MSQPEAAPDQRQEPSGRPARYNRSFGGLVGSMILAVVLVVAFVGFRGLNRDNPEVSAGRVDYLETLRLAQAGGQDTLLYPAELPTGWRATRVTAGEVWGISLLTDDERYVGIRQALGSGTDLQDLVTTYVDEEATEGEPVELDGAVAPTWRTFADEEGDSAFAAEVGGAWVLVFGSAPEADLAEVVGRLTDAPL